MANDIDVLRAPVLVGRSPTSTNVQIMRAPVLTGRELNSNTVKLIRRPVLVNLAGVAQPASTRPTVVTEIF